MTEPGIEAAARIVDAEYERIMSKQTETDDPLSMTDTVNLNLRMMACVLPDLSAAIRALRPAASGDLRERIARVLCERRGVNPDWSMGVDKNGYHQEPFVSERPSWDWFYGADADAILAALPYRDEETIRKDERERCAKIAENFDHADTWPGCDADHELSTVAHVIGGETCDAIAATLRSLKAGSGDDSKIYSVEYDGFVGTMQGSYVTREGREGAVLQQVGTKVVHVYGRNRIKIEGRE
jgi:hypothetical protein